MPASNADHKVLRIASLTLVNAMIFQQVLAEQDERIKSLNRTVEGKNVAESLFKTWGSILKIDYVPIFTTAKDILRELVGVPDADAALKTLADAALRITSRRAALRHDLMGRIYHRLLGDAKFFGAFYTTVPAATLLLKLTLEPSEFEIDWGSLKQIGKLRIADLACGTGTLLKATLQTIVENHVRARAERGQLPDLKGVHKILVENVLWGLDVVPFAIHLAASALALHEPDVEFGVMNLSTLPIGGKQTRLGSLDLLTGKRVSVQADLFGAAAAPARVSGKGEIKDRIDLPKLDLCVMNPPFTRSVGGNLLFGHAPAKERARMQTALKKIVADEGIPANITAGLGSVFVALGNLRLNEGGHISLVLPRALLSGVAWRETRKLLGNNYHVKYIIVSHQPWGWNFSENTKLSECLIVAQKKNPDNRTKPTKTISLWTKPKSSVEALTLASLIRNATGASLDAPSGTDELRTPNLKYGEVTQSPARDIKDQNWNEGAVFAQTELGRATHFLSSGRVFVPGSGVVGKVPLVRLKSIADLGPDARDIHDGFKATDQKTEYPAYWGHDNESVQAIDQSPNKYLMALARAKKGRNLRDAHLLWSRAGTLLISERLRLTTARVVAIVVDKKVLSNTWWPVVIDTREKKAKSHDKVLALWLNSTLGLLLLIAARVDTEGAWIKLKKPILEEMAVLNLNQLDRKVEMELCDAYDEVSKLQVQALPSIDVDPVHRKIDEAITSAFGIDDDLGRLRNMLAREPIVSMRLPNETVEKKSA
jgi:N-6 DNA methylase